MKVAHLIDTFEFAGVERYVLQLSRGLRKLGVEASIACPVNSPLGKIAQGEGILSLDLNCLRPRVTRTFFRLVAALRSGQCDILHAHNGLTALMAAAACGVARRGALVTTRHRLEYPRMQRRGLKAVASNLMHRWVDHSTARIVAIADVVRQALLAQGCAASKAVLVLNGIEDPRRENLAPREAVRAALGIAPGTPLVITSARLAKEKGLDVLVNAMSQVAAQVPEVRCVIAGEGKMRGELEGLTRAVGMTGAVSLLGFRQDVLSLVAAADVFVLPSLAEPFGLALVEAMALGVPTIATRAGGPPEILDGGKSGLLVAPGDPAELARAIVRLLREPGLARELGRLGRERFTGHFTVQRMAEQMRAVYEEASTLTVT